MFGLKMCATTTAGYEHNNNNIYIKHSVSKRVGADKLHKTNNNNHSGQRISEINCENCNKFNKINGSNNSNNYNNQSQRKIVVKININDSINTSWSTSCDCKVNCNRNGRNCKDNNKAYQRNNSCGSNLAFIGDKFYACNGRRQTCLGA